VVEGAENTNALMLFVFSARRRRRKPEASVGVSLKKNKIYFFCVWIFFFVNKKMPYVKKSYVKKRPAYKKKYAGKGKGPARSSRGYQRSKYLGPALGVLGAGAASALGQPWAAPIAAVGGQLLGDGSRTLTGYGDYKIKSNTIMMGHPPSVVNRARAGGSIIISHKEYLGDILSASTANTFNVQSFALQPGSGQTFPWLSQIAGNFQEYRFRGLVFQFRSMSADALNSTNTALGSLVMSTEYNAAAPAFSSKAEMENAQFANSIKPSESCMHFIECAKQSTVLSNLYIRTDAVNSATEDIRFYDMGNFYIASTGCQGTNVNLGELWVTYEVELFKPRLWNAIGESIAFYNAYTLTGVAVGDPFGTAELVVSENSNILPVVDVSARTITMPASGVPKSFMLRFLWRGTRTANLDPPATTFTNCQADREVMCYQASPLSFATAMAVPDQNANSDSVYLEDVIFFNTDGQNKEAVITMGTGGTLPASAVLFAMQILQVPNTYAFS